MSDQKGAAAGAAASTPVSPTNADEQKQQAERPKPVVDPNKDLWSNIQTNVKEIADSSSDQIVLFVGARHSGKSSLILRFNNKPTATKPTTALEYSVHEFAKREDRTQSHIVHFWELAQGLELAQLADVVLTPENIHQTLVCITVDCLDLSTAFQTAFTWFQKLDIRVREIFQKMRAKGSNTPDKMIGRMKRRIGENHPDIGSNRLNITGVPTVLICNRIDMSKEDTVRTKILVKTMRFLAHINGAALIFTSEAKTETSKLQALLSHMIFQVPLDERIINYDPEKGGVLVPPGSDTIANIGDPHPSAPRDFQSCGDRQMDSWKAPFDELWPPKVMRDAPGSTSGIGPGAMPGAGGGAGGGASGAGGSSSSSSKSGMDEFWHFLYDAEKGHAEAIVDATRKQKDSELEQYRRALAAKQNA